MKDIWNVVNGLKPAMLMVVVQITFSSVNVIYKLAINDGMSVRVATAYRLIFATAFTVPLAIVSERRKRNITKLSWRVLFMAFLCGLFGQSLFQNLFLEALALTSPTFVSATFNLVPAMTFILAISCGYLERLNLGTAAGKAKVLGSVIGIGGAMLLTFFKGAEMNICSSHINLLHPRQQQDSHVAPLHTASGPRFVGILLAIISCFSYALWLIIQAKMSKEYPSQISSTALMSLMGAIQCTIFALSTEKDWSQWKLGWNIRLLAVAYSGTMASGMMVIVIAWCVKKRGPLFASVFNPLMIVLVAIASNILLDEQLHLGSVIGAALIVCGLYMVLWGKGKEMKKTTQEFEAVEVVVVSAPVGEKDDQNNHSNTDNTCNVVNKDDETIHKKTENEGKEEESL
ncbi:hypothetical protein L6164_036265 [Bauhinia variegata]|uniref:Uncharacterized protein n=1 Tax=Bauhinia variegata TaxID=167791 RepID=A0ACB9KGK1_BAUVA|nr:hypothetical protein L6164_036265 [Bauhinia variegata]